MKDLHSKIKLVSLVGNSVLAADNTPAALDLQGYDSVEIALALGIGGITFDATNKIEFKLTESDDNVTYAAVDISDMLGLQSVGAGGIIKSLVAAHAAAAVYRFGYKGGKRYLKLLADFSGTHGTGTPVAVAAILGNGFSNPQVDQA
jgi:hypothetical protein